eukprot:Lithocolla_globosa_v1_NODE_601_length_3621_cov_48.971957.p4 type:complete len:114 gc:universal NODE_601_length_3621_cov_48.971957:1280-1621(+)
MMRCANIVSWSRQSCVIRLFQRGQQFCHIHDKIDFPTAAFLFWTTSRKIRASIKFMQICEIEFDWCKMRGIFSKSATWRPCENLFCHDGVDCFLVSWEQGNRVCIQISSFDQR